MYTSKLTKDNLDYKLADIFHYKDINDLKKWSIDMSRDLVP